jgi:hypothetical protein
MTLHSESRSTGAGVPGEVASASCNSAGGSPYPRRRGAAGAERTFLGEIDYGALTCAPLASPTTPILSTSDLPDALDGC